MVFRRALHACRDFLSVLGVADMGVSLPSRWITKLGFQIFVRSVIRMALQAFTLDLGHFGFSMLTRGFARCGLSFAVPDLVTFGAALPTRSIFEQQKRGIAVFRRGIEHNRKGSKSMCLI